MVDKKAVSSIVISRAALLPALATAVRVVERRNTIPVLANIMLAAEAGSLTIQATDLDIQITARLTCQLAGPAVSTTLPAQNLHDIVRKLPDGCEITLSGDEREWTIAGGRSKFRLPCLPASDFPVMPAVDPGEAFSLPAENLRRAIEAVRFAISTEETRYYLNGIHLHRDAGNGLIAVTTDGHRLARMPMQLAEPIDLPAVIVPRKTVDQILKVLPEKGEVKLGLSASRVSLELESVALVSKLIDGTYPDYQRVVPQENANRYLVDRAQLAAAVDRVTTIASSSHAVKFSFAEGELTLTADNPDSGSAEETVPISLISGDPVEIGFNGRYCLDMLATANSENVVFELADGGSPARVVLDGADDWSPYFVIMPMRV
jgi:DNA polymerase-3 subunit beta